MERSDVDLVQAMAAGDRDAFAELYDRYAHRVFALILRWVNSRADAEDVLQETFWQIWTQASRYDPTRAPPTGWVFLIARSRALDVLRRRRPETGTAAVQTPVAVSNPSLAAECDESAERVNGALRTLPAEQRSAVCLAFLDGLTHEQVACRQGVPLGTVKTRIRLGMRRLRDLLCTEPEYLSSS